MSGLQHSVRSLATLLGGAVALSLSACTPGTSAAPLGPPSEPPATPPVVPPASPPAAPTVVSIRVAPDSTALTPEATQVFTATAKLSDSSAATVSVAWSATGGTIDSLGSYVAPLASGTYRVIARHGGSGRSDTARVVVSPPPAATLTSLQLSPDTATVSPGASLTFRATARWSDGSTQTPTLNWSATGGTISSAGVYSAAQAPGTFRVVVRHATSGLADTSRVTIPVVVTSCAVAPVTVSLRPGETQQFAVTASRSDGTSGLATTTWSATGGTITNAGLYSAGSTMGSYRVVAAIAATSISCASAVTIVAAAPTVTALEVTPVTATLAAGATRQFSAVQRLSDGTTASVTPTWTATGGTIDASGLYTAGAAAGAFLVIGRSGTFADTSAVTVTVASGPTVTGLKVTPAAVTVGAAATQQFSAMSQRSDGSTATPSPATLWTATGGTITAGGLFTAGATAGSFRVIGSSGTFSDTASVTVTAPPPTSAQVLLAETFANASFASRGWYDNTTQPRVATAPSGLPGSVEWNWGVGATVPTNGGAMRHALAPTETIYVSYRVQRSANWVGSGRAYHPHEIMILTDQDDQYAAPADNWLNLYIESNYQSGIKPVVKFQDNRAIRTDAIGSIPATTPENRAVSGCNGQQGPGTFECYAAGSTTGWYNARQLAGAVVAAPGDAGWHRVEVYVKLNTVVNGVAQLDGIVRYWWDGALKFEYSNVIMRSGARPTLKFAQLLFGPYIGDGSPVAQSERIADLVVATDRIP